MFDWMKGNAAAGRAVPGTIARTHRDAGRALVITSWSSKGGVGKSTVAVNVAAWTALAGLRTVIVDLDESGSSGYMAAHQDRIGAVEGKPEALRKDLMGIASASDLEPYLVKSEETGCYVLLTASEQDRDKRLTGDDYEAISGVLRRYFDVVVFDCGPSFQQEKIRRAILSCDVLIAVFNQNADMLPNFLSMIKEFSKPESGVGKDKMVLVMNGYKEMPGILTYAQAKQAFGRLSARVLKLDKDQKARYEVDASGDLLVRVTKDKGLLEGYSELVQAAFDTGFRDKR